MWHAWANTQILTQEGALWKRVFEKKVSNDFPLIWDTLEPFQKELVGIVVKSTYNDGRMSPFLGENENPVMVDQVSKEAIDFFTRQIRGFETVVVVKEKRKKISYLVSTNLHLSALKIVKHYAKRWKIEQMIKDLKQRLGFGHYQVRNLQAIQRDVALSL